MKKVIALLLIVNMLLVSVYNTAQAGEGLYIEYGGQVYRYTGRQVSLVIDEKPVETGEMPAIIIEGRTLVPAREVFESAAINAKVDWNGKTNEVKISYSDKVIVLKIGSNVATVNGQEVALEVPADLIRDLSKKNPKTMIPLRFVTEYLGYGIAWESETYTARIVSPAVTTPKLPTEIQEDLKPDTTEILEGVSSDKAKRLLPTALIDNPIVWTSSTSDLSGTTIPEASIIEKQNNPQVDITEIEYSEQNNQREFIIQASGPISEANYHFFEGKFVVDIHNADYKLDSGKSYQLTYVQNPVVTVVKASPQELNQKGEKVLRVVFDLKNPKASYKLSISQDRRKLSLIMVENKLQSVVLGQNEKGDFIKLKGITAPEVKAFRLSNPDRIVFDLSYTMSQLGSQSAADISGQYVKAIRTAQFNPYTSRVVIETDGQADYKIDVVDAQTTLIQLLEPSYDNINYVVEKHPTIILENAKDIPLDAITYEDLYFEKKYIIHLPGNYENVFGTGGIHVDDKYIDSINIEKNKLTGFTDIVINENDIYVFRIEKDANNVYLKAYKPREIYPKIVVIDFGHGGKDPGAVRKDPGGALHGLQEKDLNLIIGNMVKGYMEADGSIKVYYTRRDDTYVSLTARTDLANDVEADFLVSIHNNSYYASFSGTETWYYEDKDRPGLNSSELAKIMHKYLVAATGLPNRNERVNNSLAILKNSKMPAVILEGGYISNVNDSQVLVKPEVQERMAKAIYDGIVETFAQYPAVR